MAEENDLDGALDEAELGEVNGEAELPVEEQKRHDDAAESTQLDLIDESRDLGDDEEPPEEMAEESADEAAEDTLMAEAKERLQELHLVF